eukprot:9476279-Pyramimonas_sp.AAC.1
MERGCPLPGGSHLPRHMAPRSRKGLAANWRGKQMRRAGPFSVCRGRGQRRRGKSSLFIGPHS